MIRGFGRKVVGLLASTRLALGLIVFVGIWSVLATVIAQGGSSSRGVTAWAAAYPFLEPLVRIVGLHHAFTAPVFLSCVVLLGVSTAVCATRRTKAAFSRAGTLRAARSADADALAERHDTEIPFAAGLGEEDVLSIAARTLGSRGIRTRRRGGLLVAASSRVNVWGSTVFHWSLVALVAAIFLGQMVRSEGLIQLAVTQTKPDAPTSYVALQSGPWRARASAERSLRLDALEPDYKTGGVDRGAVPTVSLLDAAGKVIVKQRVYPNNMLHSGALAISAPTVGLAVWFVSLDDSGTVVGRYAQPVDFSQDTSGGTTPALALARGNAPDGSAERLYVSVPLDLAGGGYGEWVPDHPSAHVIVLSAQDEVLLDRVIKPREDVPLPGGGKIRLLGVGWYSLLAVVDDPTIPFIYAAMVIAMLGLTMSVALRQHLVIVGVADGDDGPVLAMRSRLWRNVPTSRSEMESDLREALNRVDDGS